MSTLGKTLYVFDIDGTLTNTVPMHQQAFKDALLEIGIDIMQVETRTFKHHTDSYFLNKLYKIFFELDIPTKKAKAFEQIFYSNIKTYNVQAIPGAKTLIDEIILNPKFDLCFATGSLLRPAKYKLEQIGIHDHKDLLVAADSIFDRETIVSNAIHQAKKRNNVQDYSRIISVGDGIWDLKTAQNLGLEFIGIGLEHQTILQKNGACKLYTDLTSIQLS